MGVKVITIPCTIASLTVLGLAGVAGAKTVSITFWEAHSQQEEAATLRIIQAFEAKYPNIRIKRQKTDFGYNFEKLLTAASAGVAPDVSPIWGGFLTQFAAMGALTDLTPYGAAKLKAGYFQAPWAFTQYKGNTWGIPYASDPRFLVYNKDMFAQAGLANPPGSWLDWAEYSRKLTKKEGTRVKVAGTALIPNMDTFSSFLWQAGGDFLNADRTKSAMDSRAAGKAMKFLADLAASGTTVWGSSYGGQPEFLASRCAMYVDGPWIMHEYTKAGKKFKYAVAPIPVPEGGTSTNLASIGAYVVYKQSKYKKEAYEFIKFLGSREAQAIRVAHLKPSCRPDALKLEAGRATLAQYPQFEAAHDYLAESRIYPLVSRWTHITQIVDEEVTAGVQGKKGVEQALKAADSRIDKILAMKSSFR